MGKNCVYIGNFNGKRESYPQNRKNSESKPE